MTGQRLSRIILVSTAAVLLTPFHSRVVNAAKPGNDTPAQMFPTCVIWPDTPDYDSLYDDEYNDPDATGQVKVMQPNRNIDVIIAVTVKGLLPDTYYIVKFDTDGNGTNWDIPCPPWTTPPTPYFLTDAAGRGNWNYTARAGTLDPGVHTWSVFINLASFSRSILVSEDITFTIPSR